MVALVALALLRPGMAAKIVAGAKAQLAKPAQYDASYQRLAYPGGDVPADRGACTDVVIRAYRHAGFDLQKLVHEDAESSPKAYPAIKKLDANIDHRRVPNLVVFFARKGQRLPLDRDWLPGDIVAWKLPSNLDHIGILADLKGHSGDWLVVHNLSETAEEDALHAFRSRFALACEGAAARRKAALGGNFGKGMLHHLATAMQPGPHRPDRRIQRLRDLLIAQLIEEEQLARLPILVRQRGHHAFDRRPIALGKVLVRRAIALGRP